MEVGERRGWWFAPVLVLATTNSAATGDVGLGCCRRSRSSFVGFVGSFLRLLQGSTEDSMVFLVGCWFALVVGSDRVAAGAAIARMVDSGCTTFGIDVLRKGWW